MADTPVVYSNRPIDTSIGTTGAIDFSSELTLDHESEVPLLTLSSKIPSQKTDYHEFKFAVDRFAPRTATTADDVVAGGVGASKTVTVAAGTGVYFTPGDTVEAEGALVDATHTEQLYVESIAGDVLTCYPYDPANLGIADIPNGSIIRRIAPAMKEGSSGTNSSQTVPTVYNQYVQSFEHYYDITRLQEADRQYTGPERSRLREQARKKHALDQEYALFLSKKVKDTRDATKPRYQMDGLIAQIKSNHLVYGATLESDDLFSFMVNVHNPAYSGGNRRMVLASMDLLASISKLAMSSIRITPKESSWGVNITEVAFAGVVWEFVLAPTLSEARPGWGVVIHPRYIKKRTFINTVYEMNVQNRIDKFSKDGFYTVMAIECRLEEIMGVIRPA